MLQKARNFSLAYIPPPIPRALLLGDGDGRLALELLKHSPNCSIVSIDSSEGMIEEANRRLEQHFGKVPENFRPACADALTCDFTLDSFDYIGLHFFLDCFSDDEAAQLIHRCSRALRPGGVISYADFQIPEKQPQRIIGKALVDSLYWAFRMTTNLQTKQLPKVQWPEALQAHATQSFLGGILRSEVLTKPST